ncbi:hypothetical protein NLS1_21660 [Nocardioides sp. LS1]|nr:hypothetical protein NLS1_21660 [Nocardioides sp. LS1]
MPRLLVVRAYPRSARSIALASIDPGLSRLPFPVDQVQSDNGREFGSSFSWHPLDKSRGPHPNQATITAPRCPRPGRWKRWLVVDVKRTSE